MSEESGAKVMPAEAAVQSKQQVLLAANSSNKQASKSDQERPSHSRRATNRKAAYVRFDDYLELNEENMRRSCKKLMNHLYSEPGAKCPSSARAEGGLTSLASEEEPQEVVGSLGRASRTSSLSSKELLSTPNRRLADVGSPKSLAPTASTLAGKSYLRSQYERRQQRQLQIAGKVHQQQQQPEAIKEEGKSSSRSKRQQMASPKREALEEEEQDLVVAKSHELSKRRFFEQLQRRESMKNSNLGTQSKVGANSFPPADSFSLSSTLNLTIPQKPFTAGSLIEEAKQPIRLLPTRSTQSKTPVLGKLDQTKRSLQQSDLLLTAIPILNQSIPQVPQTGAQDKPFGVALTDTLQEPDGTKPANYVGRASVPSRNQLIACKSPPSCHLFAPGNGILGGACCGGELSCGGELIDSNSAKFNRATSAISTGEPANANRLVVVGGGGAGGAFEIRVPDSSLASAGKLKESSEGFVSSSGVLFVKKMDCDELEVAVNNQSTAPPQLTSASPSLSGRDKSRATENKTLLHHHDTEFSSGGGEKKLISCEENIVKEEPSEETRPPESIKDGRQDSKEAPARLDERADSSATTATISNQSGNHEHNNNTGTEIVSSATNCQPETTAESNKNQTANKAADHEGPETEFSEPTGADLSASPRTDAKRCLPSGVPVLNWESAPNGHESADSAGQSEREERQQQVFNGRRAVTTAPAPLETDAAIRDVAAGQFEGQFVSLTGDAAGAEKVRRAGLKEERDINAAQRDRANNEALPEAAGQSASKKELSSSTSSPPILEQQVFLVDSFRRRPIVNIEESLRELQQGQTVRQEDCGSSCGSSGFGASGVSVTCSSSSASSLTGEASSPTISHQAQAFPGPERRQEAAVYESLSRILGGCADSLPIPRRISPDELKKLELEFPDYKQLVGPDQAYPARRNLPDDSSSCHVLIENHNYASVAARRALESSPSAAAALTSGGEKDHYAQALIAERIVLEPDDDSTPVRYANLPIRRPLGCQSPVALGGGHSPADSAAAKPDWNRREQVVVVGHSQARNSNSPASSKWKKFPSAGSLVSKSSGDSGGFSKLTPVRISPGTCCSFANNFASLNYLNEKHSKEEEKAAERLASGQQQVAAIYSDRSNRGDDSQTRKSLLKRFGSLVSKAFGTNSSIDEEPAGLERAKVAASPPLPRSLQQVSSKEGAAELPAQSGHTSSHSQALTQEPASGSSLAEERKMASEAGSSVRELDLVILPTKHSMMWMESRRRRMSCSQPKRHLRGAAAGGRRQAACGSLQRRHSRSASPSSRNSRSSSAGSARSPDFRLQRGSRQRCSSFGRISADSLEQKSSSLARRARPAASRRMEIDCPLKLLPAARARRPSNSKGATSKAPPAPPPSQSEWGQLSCLTSGSPPATGFWSQFPINGLMSYGHGRRGSSKEVSSRSSLKERQQEAAPKRTSKSKSSRADLNGEPIELALSEQQVASAAEKAHSLRLYKSLLRKYASQSAKSKHQMESTELPAGQRSTFSRHSLRSGSNSSGAQTSSTSGNEEQPDAKPAVWGQLIKINKSDGSQVIELERVPGKAWGFFVARGAINNARGIFISRMQADQSRGSLEGLLGIGDRILAIDENPVEQDCDILQVNQMISKKSKILLRVKPFKG